MPYRSAHVEGPKLRPEAGIVDDMVRQFADRHAFLRELVQNGIDAGATRIDVRLERSPDGAVRTTVEDDGCGMTRAIIEGPLLTLFESSKESDSTKIGKYGIGFVSIFAIEPERVDVRTRCASEAWLVKLFGDHSFELSEDALRPGTGTEVTLLHTMSADRFGMHVEQARTALTRWCRHAHVPITFVALDGYEGGAAKTINAPLALPGVVSVAATKSFETLVVSVGQVDHAREAGPASRLLEDQPTFAGFYNRGLTLIESTDGGDVVLGVRFKVDSPHLSHTLSRDSVRKDDAYRAVVERVQSLVDGALWTELHGRIAVAAQEAATSDGTAYAALLAAARVPRFAARCGTLAVPLVEPIGGASTLEMRALRSRSPGKSLLAADASSLLTRALARGGCPVIRHVGIATVVGALLKKSTVRVEQSYAFAAAIEPRDGDEALTRELARLLHASGRKVERACLALFDGVASDAACRVVDTDEADAVTAPERAFDRPWGGGATLFLNEAHAVVRLARRRAKSDAGVAAHLLCRAILLGEGPLDARVVDRLLDAAGSSGESR